MDPRTIGPQQRRANLSDLMLAKGRQAQGERLNFCPFGCAIADLDDNGYCRHLVGFTEDRKEMEPMVMGEGFLAGRKQVRGDLKEPVRGSDQFVRITTCYRVYRKDEVAEGVEIKAERVTRKRGAPESVSETLSEV